MAIYYFLFNLLLFFFAFVRYYFQLFKYFFLFGGYLKNRHKIQIIQCFKVNDTKPECILYENVSIQLIELFKAGGNSNNNLILFLIYYYYDYYIF